MSEHSHTERHSAYARMQINRSIARVFMWVKFAIAAVLTVIVAWLAVYLHTAFAMLFLLPLAFILSGIWTLLTVRLSERFESKMRANDRAGRSNRPYEIAMGVGLIAILLIVSKDTLVDVFKGGFTEPSSYEVVTLGGVVVLSAMTTIFVIFRKEDPLSHQRSETEERALAATRARRIKLLSWGAFAIGIVVFAASYAGVFYLNPAPVPYQR